MLHVLYFFQLHVPLEFWEDCVLAVVYIINHRPTPILSNKSPYEKLYNKPPYFLHFKVFDCQCYIANVHPK